MKPTIAATVMAIAAVASAPAAARSLEPGGYIADGGWGALTIDGKGGFSISTVGANGHTCGLDGALHGLTGKVSSSDDPKDVCLIEFAPGAGSIDVTPKTGDTCSGYCGARAHFDGTYLKPSKGCADAERESTRKLFKAEYDAKAYARAAATLAPLLGACARQLSWLDAAWIRNDLALTRHRLADDSGCLAALKPLVEDASSSDDTLRENYPPSDFEDYFPIVKATRANLELCRAAR